MPTPTHHPLPTDFLARIGELRPRYEEELQKTSSGQKGTFFSSETPSPNLDSPSPGHLWQTVGYKDTDTRRAQINLLQKMAAVTISFNNEVEKTVKKETNPRQESYRQFAKTQLLVALSLLIIKQIDDTYSSLYAATQYKRSILRALLKEALNLNCRSPIEHESLYKELDKESIGNCLQQLLCVDVNKLNQEIVALDNKTLNQVITQAEWENLRKQAVQMQKDIGFKTSKGYAEWAAESIGGHAGFFLGGGFGLAIGSICGKMILFSPLERLISNGFVSIVNFVAPRIGAGNSAVYFSREVGRQVTQGACEFSGAYAGAVLGSLLLGKPIALVGRAIDYAASYTGSAVKQVAYYCSLLTKPDKFSVGMDLVTGNLMIIDSNGQQLNTEQLKEILSKQDTIILSDNGASALCPQPLTTKERDEFNRQIKTLVKQTKTCTISSDDEGRPLMTPAHEGIEELVITGSP